MYINQVAKDCSCGEGRKISFIFVGIYSTYHCITNSVTNYQGQIWCFTWFLGFRMGCLVTSGGEGEGPNFQIRKQKFRMIRLGFWILGNEWRESNDWKKIYWRPSDRERILNSKSPKRTWWTMNDIGNFVFNTNVKIAFQKMNDTHRNNNVSTAIKKWMICINTDRLSS